VRSARDLPPAERAPIAELEVVAGPVHLADPSVAADTVMALPAMDAAAIPTEQTH